MDRRPPDVGTTVAAPRAEDPRSNRAVRRRAALISSSVAVPVAVLVAFALTSGSRNSGSTPAASTTGGTGVLAPLTIAPLPANPASDHGCLKVVEQLPVDLGPRAPRRVFSSSTYIVAWGEPPVVLRCGVGRPVNLAPGSSDQVIDTGTGTGRTVQWFPVKAAKSTMWTTIDRAVYVEVTVPNTIQPADVLPPLSAAIATALPAVCQAFPQPAPSVFDQKLKNSLCVFRK